MGRVPRARVALPRPVPGAPRPPFRRPPFFLPFLKSWRGVGFCSNPVGSLPLRSAGLSRRGFLQRLPESGLDTRALSRFWALPAAFRGCRPFSCRRAVASGVRSQSLAAAKSQRSVLSYQEHAAVGSIFKSAYAVFYLRKRNWFVLKKKKKRS